MTKSIRTTISRAALYAQDYEEARQSVLDEELSPTSAHTITMACAKVLVLVKESQSKTAN